MKLTLQESIYDQVYGRLFYNWYKAVEGPVLNQAIPQLSINVRDELGQNLDITSNSVRAQVSNSLYE